MRYIDEENLLPKALNMPRQEIERTMQLFLDFYFNGILPHRTQSPAVLDVSYKRSHYGLTSLLHNDLLF